MEASARTLGDLLAEIKKKSGIRFTMRKTQANDAVTVSFRDVPIETAIRRIVARDFDLVWFYVPSKSGRGTPMPIEVWVVGRAEGGGAVLADEPAAASLPRLIAALGDPDPRVRAAAALGGADRRDAIEPLGKVLTQDGGAEVRMTAAEAMGEVADSAALAPLGRALVEDRDSDVRAAAADALGEVGSPEAVALLRAGLNDADPQVRASVVQALGIIAGREAERLLREALTDKDEDVRVAAFEALARLTPKTK